MHVRARRRVLLVRGGARAAAHPGAPGRRGAGWVDGAVEDPAPAFPDAAPGALTVRTLDGARTLRLWHAGTTGLVHGDPVAVHTVYGVLAAGGRRRNVAVLA